jgi:hypothetical protein
VRERYIERQVEGARERNTDTWRHEETQEPNERCREARRNKELHKETEAQ